MPCTLSAPAITAATASVPGEVQQAVVSTVVVVQAVVVNGVVAEAIVVNAGTFLIVPTTNASAAVA